MEFSIGNRKIGKDSPALIIAEVAQAHDGSVNFAHSFIDSAEHFGRGRLTQPASTGETI